MNKAHTPRYVDIGSVERCSQHQHNVIIYYCNIHDDIGCHECMSTNHSACATESIDSIAKGTKDCLEYNTLIKGLSEVKSQAEENEKKAIENKLNSDICLSTVMQDIRTFRHDIDAHLDQMEIEMSSRAKEVNLEYQMIMNEIISDSKTIQENIEQFLKEIKDIEAKETRLFIKMKQKRAEVLKYKHCAERNKAAQKTQSFTFEPNPNLADIFRTRYPFGKLLAENDRVEETKMPNQTQIIEVPLGHDVYVQGSEPDESSKEIRQTVYSESEILENIQNNVPINTNVEVNEEKKDTVCDATYQQSKLNNEAVKGSSEFSKGEHDTDNQKGITMCTKGKINAKSLSDKEECDISGIDMLSENEIVLADYNNRSVKVVDLIQNKITDEIKLEFHPYDLTVPTANTLAVTLTNTIQIIEKSHLLRLSDNIKVDGECYGIASSRAKLFVSFIKPAPKVEVLNMQGDVLQKMDLYTSEHRILKRPRYIDVSSDEKYIYITDFATDSILRVSATGEETKVFTNAAILNGPYGIHVDDNDRVLVCNYGNDNIFEFSEDLSKHTLFLSKSEGIESPQSIYKCKKENKLFVACTDSADCNDIHIFS